MNNIYFQHYKPIDTCDFFIELLSEATIDELQVALECADNHVPSDGNTNITELKLKNMLTDYPHLDNNENCAFQVKVHFIFWLKNNKKN